jgi:hypothetical protein
VSRRDRRIKPKLLHLSRQARRIGCPASADRLPPMDRRYGVAALVLSPTLPADRYPNAHAPSVLDALVMAEDYERGKPVCAADREPASGILRYVRRGVA